jgi:hypothetical protein
VKRRTGEYSQLGQITRHRRIQVEPAVVDERQPAVEVIAFHIEKTPKIALGRQLAIKLARRP